MRRSLMLGIIAIMTVSLNVGAVTFYNQDFEEGSTGPGKPLGWIASSQDSGDKTTTYSVDDIDPFEGSRCALMETTGTPGDPNDLSIASLTCNNSVALEKDHTYAVSAAVRRSHTQWTRFILFSSGFSLIHTESIDALDDGAGDSDWQIMHLHFRAPSNLNAFIRIDSIVTNDRTDGGQTCSMWVDDIKIEDLGIETYISNYNVTPPPPQYGIRNRYFDLGTETEIYTFGGIGYSCTDMPKRWSMAMAVDEGTNHAPGYPKWGQETPALNNTSGDAGYIKAKAANTSIPAWPAMAADGIRVNQPVNHGQRHVLTFDYGAGGTTKPLLRVFMINDDYSHYASLFVDPTVGVPGNRMWPLSLHYTPGYGDEFIKVRFDNVTLGASGTGVHTDEAVAYIDNADVGFVDPALDSTAPAAPAGVNAKSGDGLVVIEGALNEEDDFVGYNIYRSATSGSGYTKINTALLSGPDELFYIDDAVTNGNDYYYVVTAVDSRDNESGNSPEVMGSPVVIGEVTQTITPGGGGEVEIPGEIKIEVPAGTTSEIVDLTIRKLSEGEKHDIDPSTGAILLGGQYEIEFTLKGTRILRNGAIFPLSGPITILFYIEASEFVETKIDEAVVLIETSVDYIVTKTIEVKNKAERFVIKVETAVENITEKVTAFMASYVCLYENDWRPVSDSIGVSGFSTTSDDVIVFVHGIIAQPDTWTDLATYLAGEIGADYQAYTFSYCTSQLISLNGALLSTHLDYLRGIGNNIYIIAHSMGCLVTKKAIDDNPNVKKIIYIAGVHDGTPLADFANAAMWLETLLNGPGIFIPINSPGVQGLRSPGISKYDIDTYYTEQYALAGTDYGIYGLLQPLFLGAVNDGWVPYDSARGVNNGPALGGVDSGSCYTYFAAFDISHAELPGTNPVTDGCRGMTTYETVRYFLLGKPKACFTVDPPSGTTSTTFGFDASCSDDPEDGSNLHYRWDWENDGTWDSSWSSIATASHQYVTENTYTVMLEVKDSDEVIDSVTEEVTVIDCGVSLLNSNANSDWRDDRYPQVTTDGLGNWVAVWRSEENLGGTAGTDRDIFTSRSTDNGVTWSAVNTLNSNADIDSGSDDLPHLATDGIGNWIVVWESDENLGGTAGTDIDIFISRSIDNGITWSPVMTLNTNSAVDTGDDGAFLMGGGPKISTDGSGNWIVVWESFENLGGMVGTDTDIFFSRSSDNGISWRAPETLNTNANSDYPGYDRSPDISTDKNGNWITIWMSTNSWGDTIGTDYDVFVSCSSNNGITWSPVSILNSIADVDHPEWGYDYTPQITTDCSGNWVAVWYSTEELGGYAKDDMVSISRSTDNGSIWSPVSALYTFNADHGGDEVFWPQVATDGIGNWIAVWTSNEDLGGMIDDDTDVFVSRSINNGVTWTAPSVLNSNAYSDREDDDLPQITTDGKGNWITVWQSCQDPEGSPGPSGDDLDILFSLSRDNGVTWEYP